MEEHRKQGLIKSLKRLVLAYDAFEHVIALSDHLHDSKITAMHPIYTPCLAGIAATYMKPFVESEGLGPLPSEFSEFDDLHLKNAHERLKESRHKVYAHRDITAASSLKYDHPLDSTPYKITVELTKERPPTFYVGIPDLNPEIGYYVRALCVFQSKRATEKMGPIMNQLIEGKHHKAGRYVLGEDFP